MKNFWFGSNKGVKNDFPKENPKFERSLFDHKSKKKIKITSSFEADEFGSLLLDLPAFRRLKKDRRVDVQLRREPSEPSVSTPKLRFINNSSSTWK